MTSDDPEIDTLRYLNPYNKDYDDKAGSILFELYTNGGRHRYDPTSLLIVLSTHSVLYNLGYKIKPDTMTIGSEAAFMQYTLDFESYKRNPTPKGLRGLIRMVLEREKNSWDILRFDFIKLGILLDDITYVFNKDVEKAYKYLALCEKKTIWPDKPPRSLFKIYMKQRVFE